MLELILGLHHLRALRMIPAQGNGVKLALGSADAAADTLILVHDGGAATKTSCRLLAHLLLGQGQMSVLKGFGRYCLVHAFDLAGGIIVALYGDIALIQLVELPTVPSDGHMAVVDVAVQGFCRVVACRDGGGVSIGDDVIIAAGSVVIRDIPSGVLAGGNPCKVIRKLTPEDDEKYKKGFQGFSEG